MSMSTSMSMLMRSSSRRSSNPPPRPPPRLAVTTTTPPSPPPAAASVAETGGNVSPTIRRWQHTFQVIQRDRYLVNQFLRRLHTPGAGAGGADFFARFFLLRFEDTIRRVIRQELHQVLTYFNLPPRLLPNQHIPARYQLRFINSVKSPAFTTEKGDPIQVWIYDSCSQKLSPDCLFSSVKVRITVLDAEFWKNKGETWSRSDFNDSILSDRDRKEPILTSGGRTFKLKGGEGASEEISFGDNSSWTKSGFRLGVMLEVAPEQNGERVQEGVSEPFVVKDRRVKASQKPNHLELKHKVQNLKKIGKDRASRLENNGIKTVEDFLRLYYHDESELRKILGFKSESDKEWDTMVMHAKECDNEFHAKNNALKSTSQPQQVSMDKEVNILNTNKFYCEYPIDNNMNFASTLESDASERNSYHFVISSEHLVHTSGCDGLLVGSGSSEPNPCENYLINPGLDQLEIPSDSVPMEILFSNAESTPSNIRQFHSMSQKRSRIEPPAEYEALENTCLPQQALGYPLERNASPLPSGGPLVLSPKANSHDNNENYQACYEQISPFGDVSSIVSNEQISAAAGEHPVDTQGTLFHEINHMAIQTGNVLNVNSMQQTYADGLEFPDDMVAMEYLYALADSTPDNIGNGQVPLITDSFDAGLGEAWVPNLIPEVSSSVYAGLLSPHRKAKRKALLKWITWPAVVRKRARITQAAIQTTVPAM